MSTVGSRQSNRPTAVSPETDAVAAFTLRVMLNVAALLGVYLLVSGVVLVLGGYQAVNPDGFWPLSHRWAAYGFTGVAILSVPFGLSLSMFRLKLAPVAVTTGAILFAIVLGFTGSALAFSQIALWEAPVGADDQSFLRWLFQPGVRFFIVDGAEVSPTRMRVFTLLHALLLPLIVAGMGAVLGRFLRPSWSRQTPDEPSASAAKPVADPNEPTWL